MTTLPKDYARCGNEKCVLRRTCLRMTDVQKLEFGIEIVAAMKASAYNTDIESGRLMALEDTELDRLGTHTLDEYNSLENDLKSKIKDFQERQKKQLHKQALFVADVALSFLNAL